MRKIRVYAVDFVMAIIIIVIFNIYKSYIEDYSNFMTYWITGVYEVEKPLSIANSYWLFPVFIFIYIVITFYYKRRKRWLLKLSTVK